MEYGCKIQNNEPWLHPTCCGVSGNGSAGVLGKTQYHKSGSVLRDSEVEFIYEKEINQMDMLVDFEQGSCRVLLLMIVTIESL